MIVRRIVKCAFCGKSTTCIHNTFFLQYDDESQKWTRSTKNFFHVTIVKKVFYIWRTICKNCEERKINIRTAIALHYKN